MSTTLLRLPSERADQLRRLAEYKRISLADLVGELATTEINRLGLVHEIGLGSTIDICRLENGLLHVDLGFGVMHWTDENMRNVIAAIESALSKKGGALDMDSGIEVSRVGTAIKVKSVGNEGERNFAPGIAKELVALMRAA